MIKRSKTNKIILHCSATIEGKDFKAAEIKRWHLQRGFSDIGYHYVIDLDGKIEAGRREDLQGAHTVGENAVSLGICYIGGLDKNSKPKDTRTDAQKKAMYELLKKMMEKYNLTINDVYLHYQFANKACPCFKIEDLKKEYNAWLKKNKKPIICPHCGKEIYN